MDDVYLALGMLVYLLLDFATYTKSLMNYSPLSALHSYLKLNGYYIVAGIIVAFVCSDLLEGGYLHLLEAVGFTFKVPMVQGGNIGTAFLFGLLNQWLVVKLRKFFKSVLVVQTEEGAPITLTKKKTDDALFK